MVPFAELGDHRAAAAALLAHPVLLDLHVAASAQAAVLFGNHQLLFRRVQRRQLVPLSNFHVAQSHAVGAAPQQVQVQPTRRLVRRVKGRMTLRARVAREYYHPVRHRVLRANGLQRRLLQDHVELRHAQGQQIQRQHHQVLAQTTRLTALAALGHDMIPVRVQLAAPRLRNLHPRSMQNIAHNTCFHRKLHVHFADLLKTMLLGNFQYDLGPRGRVVSCFGHLRVLHLRLKLVDFGHVRTGGNYTLDNTETLKTRRVVRRVRPFVCVP